MCCFQDGLSLQEQQERHKNDLATVDSYYKCEDVEIRVTCFQSLIQMMGNNLQYLRIKRKGQKRRLKSTIQKAGPNWRQLKDLQYKIDTLRAAVFLSENTISKGLQAVKASINHFTSNSGGHPVCDDGTSVDLHASNSLWLRHPDVLEEEMLSPLPPCVIKQQSPQWYLIRSHLYFTGSTYANAVGINGLKAMKTHWNMKTKNIEPSYSAAAVNAMKHGSESEIHAVATLVSFIIPSLFPALMFREEGIHLLHGIGVSPDGALVDKEGHIAYAVEIKCPTCIDETLKLPVHYDVPSRYMCQVLLEGKALDAQHGTLYVTWSNKSTTVLLAPRNSDIEQLIVTEAVQPIKCPTKVNPSVQHLSKELQHYADSIVFLGEFPSAFSKSATVSTLHESELGSPHILHLPDLHQQSHVNISNTSTSDARDECIHFVKKAYDLSRVPATQVMAFVAGNLDRIQKPEKPHTSCIGYVFRGASLTVKAMRRLRDKYLQSMFDTGLHCPVTCSDGEWFSLMAQDDSGEPLTEYMVGRKLYFGWAKKLSRKEIFNNINRYHNKDSYDITRCESVYVVTKKPDMPKPLKSPGRGWTCVKKTPEKPKLYKLTDQDHCEILEKLKKMNSKKWASKSSFHLASILGDVKMMDSSAFTIKDLKVVREFLVSKGVDVASVSGKKKTELVLDLAKCMSMLKPGNGNVKSLHDTVLPVVKKLPLQILRASIASSRYDMEVEKWIKQSPHIPDEVMVDIGDETVKFKPTYRPKLNKKRNQIETGECFIMLIVVFILFSNYSVD